MSVLLAEARTVMVLERSNAPGFAGMASELFYLDKTLVLFGAAKGFARILTWLQDHA